MENSLEIIVARLIHLLEHLSSQYCRTEDFEGSVLFFGCHTC